MKRKDYSFETKYIETIYILNWRRSSDERGLAQLQRCRYNYEMLNYLLDELMPWYKENYDFSTLEVNRYVRNYGHTVRVENFEVFLILRFSWVADDTKIIHVEGEITTREIF